MRKLTTFTAALALALGVASAGVAATCSASSGPQTVNYTLTQGNPDAVMGVACVSNANDSNTIDSSYSIFGMTGWTLAAKAGDESGGDGNVSFGDTPVSGGSSSWSLLNPNGYSNIFITLKQGQSFAAFWLDTTEALSGFWSTSGPARSSQGLSHVSVYYQGPSVVPLPAAGLMLLTALGGLAFARRRKV